ncbi:DUF6456 domain-containing protein [Octadecabacter sp. CECT 8868]|uniref:DUF6456 domain-containing protein n=1 Tax=Octadecabacter algicola TaxID=2909342 RepID=UPI001F3EF20C|nr:DUF6456 domain-containing protein [Octadecabacter algicola]MCF2903933.1 DUF6456 domain-containing protein [Octadecabacter algicola]
MIESRRANRAIPSWVPVEVRNYIFHTEMGQAIRVLARGQNCHPSTIMRQVRKVEQRRDDPLVDRAIKILAEEGPNALTPSSLELMQALRRLASPDVLLAIALGMDQGVVLKDNPTGEPDHSSKLPMQTATTLALRGWISSGQTTTRVLRYRITAGGRVALRELTAMSENNAREMAEGPASFTGAPKGVGTWDEKPVPVRAATQDSPVLALSRRKDLDGNPFINRSMVQAAERLREGYELSLVGRSMGTDTSPDWDSMLAKIEAHEPIERLKNPSADQVAKALSYLGPGLSAIALRCCCLLEGLETTEKQMGWAARSGKVVLRIALQRLVLHYEGVGGLGPKIG